MLLKQRVVKILGLLPKSEQQTAGELGADIVGCIDERFK
jgi:hypothetical protein